MKSKPGLCRYSAWREAGVITSNPGVDCHLACYARTELAGEDDELISHKPKRHQPLLNVEEEAAKRIHFIDCGQEKLLSYSVRVLLVKIDIRLVEAIGHPADASGPGRSDAMRELEAWWITSPKLLGS